MRNVHFIDNITTCCTILRRLIESQNTKDVLLIGDPHSKLRFAQPLRVLLSRAFTVTASQLVTTNDCKLINEIKKTCCTRPLFLVGIGGCTALDITRYLATVINAPYALVPTILSTNCLAVSQAVINSRGKNNTYRVKKPLAVLLIPSLIPPRSNNNYLYERYTLGAWGELLAHYSAVLDWELACAKRKDTINRRAVRKALAIAEEGMRFFESAPKRWFYNAASIKKFSQILIRSGEVSSLCDNDRPLSGAEHKIYHSLIARRHKAPYNATHGEVVVLSTLFTLALYSRVRNILPSRVRRLWETFPIATILSVTRKLGFLSKNGVLRRIPKETFYKAVVEAHNIKKERYTIVEFLRDNALHRQDMNPRLLYRRTLEELYKTGRLCQN